MKRFKCDVCSGIWIVEDTDMEKQKVCPFCASSIQETIEFSAYDSLDKVIYKAVIKKGKDILRNPKQLFGFIMDTAPNLKKETRILSKIVSDNYMEYIRDAFEQKIDVVETTMNKIHNLFVKEEGLSNDWADILCRGFYGAIQYINGVGTTKHINVKIDDFEILQKVNPNDIETKLVRKEITMPTRRIEKVVSDTSSEILRQAWEDFGKSFD